MASILDDVMGAVATVATTAAPTAMQAAGVTPVTPAGSTEDRLAALEQLALTWGPALMKLAPLLEKL